MKIDFFATNDIGDIGFGLWEKTVSIYKPGEQEQNKKLVDLFKKLYLTPTESKIGDKNNNGFSFMKWHLSLISEKEVSEHIKAMPYQLFLKTAYWKLTAKKVRRNADYSCDMCRHQSPSQMLDVHHKSYKKHGYEATSGLNDLVCLCRTCHEFEHKKHQLSDICVNAVHFHLLKFRGFV